MLHKLCNLSNPTLASHNLKIGNIKAFQQKKHVSIKKVRDQDNNWKILFEPHSVLGKKSSNESDPFVDLNDARERTQVGFQLSSV